MYICMYIYIYFLAGWLTSWMACIIFIALSEWTFSGLVCEEDYPPIKFPDVTSMVDIFPFWFLFLQAVQSNTLAFHKKLSSILF